MKEMNTKEKAIWTMPYVIAVIAGLFHYFFIRNHYGFWSWPGWSVCYAICILFLMVILYAELGVVEQEEAEE